MSNYTRTGTAELMIIAAKRYDDDGAATLARAHDLALPATHTAEVHTTSSGTSDPTYEQATAPAETIAGYLPRWLAVTSDLSRLFAPFHIAAGLRHGAKAMAGGGIDPKMVNRVGVLCDEMITIIDACRPRAHEAHKEALMEERRRQAAAGSCRACGVPIDKPENRKLNLYDQWCYKRIRMWEQAFPELGAVDDHHPEFCSWIRHHIANRIPGFDRPASIHSPIGRMMIPEDAA